MKKIYLKAALVCAMLMSATLAWQTAFVGTAFFAAATMNACSEKESGSSAAELKAQQIEAKRQEVHTTFQATVVGFKDYYFNPYFSSINNPTINDTTRVAPLARKDVIETVPSINENTLAGINKFVQTCAEYDALVK